jgi:large subunit ribosomal protein L13e
MVKHNNTTDSGHFRKRWQKNVRTSFDEPSKKLKRRIGRSRKQKITFDQLRPIVRCPTKMHNLKVKFGRGFSRNEIKNAGLNGWQVSKFKISYDKRKRSSKNRVTNIKQLKVASNFIDKVFLNRKMKENMKEKFEKSYWRWRST